MRIFRTWYTDKKTGQRRDAAKWYVEFKDHLDRRHRWPAFPDERRSYAFGAKVEKLVSVRSGGGELEQIGLLDGQAHARRMAAVKPLIVHLEGLRDLDGKTIDSGFKQALESKGNSGRHVALIVLRAKKIIEGCTFERWGDIEPG